MKLLRPLLAFALAALTAGAGAAQQIPGTELTQVLVPRSVLESLLVKYDAAAQNGPYSNAVRADARHKADLVRQRLADGDFHVGDRVLLTVEAETALTDTFTVLSGREILLPTVGAIPLQGVLRYELTDYLTTRLSRFLRDPKVRARSLIKVTILGAVNKQGFYTVPVDIPVDAVLNIAGGGPSGQADLQKISIERGNEILYDGQLLQDLITQGTTIDALGIQAGDRFRVGDLPVRQNTNSTQRIQAVQYLLALPVSILALGRLLGF